MRDHTSKSKNALRTLRRYWLPLVVVALLTVAVFGGQPAWAADGVTLGQTVPTPTPTSPPAPPTATPAPAPDNNGGNGDNDDNGGGDTGGDAGGAPASDAAAGGEAAAPAAEAAAVTETPTSTVVLTGTVTAVTLNVRQGPSTTFPAIGRFTAGTTVNVLARNVDGAWLLVCCTASGGTGWVSAEFVAPAFSAAEAAGLSVSNSLATTGTVTSTVTSTVTPAAAPLTGSGTVDVLTLNIRQGPTTSAPVVGRFRQGNTFTVQGTNEAGDWYLVCCVPGTQNPGWISAQFATLTSGAADAGAAASEAAPEAAPEATPEPAAEAPAATDTAPAGEATPAPTESAGSTSSGVTDVLW